MATDACMACRVAVTKPEVQAHRLELSDEDSDEDMEEDGVNMEQDEVIEDTASPAPNAEDSKEVSAAFASDSTHRLTCSLPYSLQLDTASC